jgi:hypothetical protein
MIQVSVPKCFSTSAQAYADNQAWSIWWYQKDRSVWVMGRDWILFLSFAVLISRKAPDSGYTLLHNNPTKVLGKPLYTSICVLSFRHISGNTMKSYLLCWLALKTYVANFLKSLVSTFKLQQACVCNITSFLTFLKSWTNQVQSLFLRSYRPNLQRKKMSWLKWKKEKVEAKSSICHHTLKSSSKTKNYWNMNECSHKLMNCHSQKCWTTTTFIVKAVSDNLPWLLRLHQLLVLGCRQVYNNSPRFPGKPITQTSAS